MTEELRKKVSELLGDTCEVDKLRNGKYVVAFMSLQSSPPPTGSTPDEAMSLFIEWFNNNRPSLKPELPDLEEKIGSSQE